MQLNPCCEWSGNKKNVTKGLRRSGEVALRRSKGPRDKNNIIIMFSFLPCVSCFKMGTSSKNDQKIFSGQNSSHFSFDEVPFQRRGHSRYEIIVYLSVFFVLSKVNTLILMWRRGNQYKPQFAFFFGDHHDRQLSVCDWIYRHKWMMNFISWC